VPDHAPSASAPPGWYPDPYEQGKVRWFDGSVWTSHSVAANRPSPDTRIAESWDPRTSEEIREDSRYPAWDVAVARRGEPAVDGPGGAGGLHANRMARVAGRYGQSHLVNGTQWLGAITLVLALLAWGDAQHRVLLIVLAVPCCVATIVVGFRRRRDRTRFEELGRNG
jgi:hypothetical protein